MEIVSIKSTFFKYVSLSTIGMIGLSCYILADTFFVAQGVGTNGLTALNLAIPIYSLIHGTGLMIGMGGATRFTLSKSSSSFVQAFYCVLMAAAFFLCSGVFFSGDLAALLGADGDTLAYTETYLKTILYFSPFFLLNNLMICFVRNDGNPKLAMTAMLAGSFSNIILDYVFIFPLNMGMFGAAFATGIAPVISLFFLSTHILKKKNSFVIRMQPLKPHTIGPTLALGLSALIGELSSGIVMIVFNFIILNLEGNVGVAAYGIIANISLVIVGIFTGIAQGMQPIVSHCYGSHKNDLMRKTLSYGFVTAISVAILAYAASWIFAVPIVNAFNRDANVRLAEISIHGLHIYFTAFGFVGVNILCAAYLSAVEHPKNAFIISILRGFVIIVPASFLLSSLFGMNGVWASMAVTECLVLLVSVTKLRAVNRA